MVLHQKNLLEVGLLHLMVESHQLLLQRWQQEDRKVRDGEQRTRQQDVEASLSTMWAWVLVASTCVAAISLFEASRATQTASRQRSSRSDANPAPRYTDKTMSSQGRNDRYDDHQPDTVQQGRYMVLPTMGWEPRQGSSYEGRPDRLKALTSMIGVVALSPMKRPGG
jgi:hypothetical protein